MEGSTVRRTGVFVALLMLVVAPVALAAEGPLEVPLPKGELGAIAYGGGHVVWATSPPTGPVRIYSATVGGGRPQLLASVPRERPEAALTVSLAASAAGYIVSLRDSSSVNSDPYGGEIFEGEVVAVGGFDGALHTVLRCHPGKASREGEFPPVGTAAGDQLFAFAGVACGAPASIDTVTPRGTVTPLPHAPRFSFTEGHEVQHVNLTLAGSTLAYTASDPHEAPLVGIDDLASGGYRQIDPVFGAITSLAARADGTVFATGTVFANGSAKRAEPASVFAVDPGQSVLRPLTGLPLEGTITVLAGGERLLLDSGDDFPDLALASASGQRLGPVGAPGVSGTHELLAFSGEQAVYTSSTCTGAAEVTVLTLPAAGPAGSGADGCPMSITSSKITVGPRGRAAVRVSCPLGCKGRLSLEVSASAATHRELARLLNHQGFQGLAMGEFKLPAGQGLVHMRLDRYARQFLAHHHGRLTAELSSEEDDPETTASIGRPVKILVRQ